MQFDLWNYKLDMKKAIAEVEEQSSKFEKPMERSISAPQLEMCCFLCRCIVQAILAIK